MGGSMTELNMKNKKQPLIAKIVVVSFVCIVILLMMASLSTLVIGSFFQENEKNGILAYELQQLYIYQMLSLKSLTLTMFGTLIRICCIAVFIM